MMEALTDCSTSVIIANIVTQSQKLAQHTPFVSSDKEIEKEHSVRQRVQGRREVRCQEKNRRRDMAHTGYCQVGNVAEQCVRMAGIVNLFRGT
jgi:hypothetical protein